MNFKELPLEDKALLDILSVGAAIGTLMNILPAIAALFTIVWTGIRIYETDTIQGLLGRPITKGDED